MPWSSPDDRRRDESEGGQVMPASKEKTREIDLLLAILAVHMRGESLSCREISRFCGTCHESIRKIEQKSLRKLRHLLAPCREEIA